MVGGAKGRLPGGGRGQWIGCLGGGRGLEVNELCVSGMLEDGVEGLHISDAYHKAFLEVSGTDDITGSFAVIG